MSDSEEGDIEEGDIEEGDIEEGEPPDHVKLTLDEALALLVDLEDAWDALVSASYFTIVAAIEDQVVLISRKLGFGDARDDGAGGDGAF